MCLHAIYTSSSLHYRGEGIWGRGIAPLFEPSNFVKNMVIRSCVGCVCIAEIVCVRHNHFIQTLHNKRKFDLQVYLGQIAWLCLLPNSALTITIPRLNKENNSLQFPLKLRTVSNCGAIESAHNKNVRILLIFCILM